MCSWSMRTLPPPARWPHRCLHIPCHARVSVIIAGMSLIRQPESQDAQDGFWCPAKRGCVHAIFDPLYSPILDCCHVQVKNPWRTIFSRRYMPELMTAIWIPIFQQLTGALHLSYQSCSISARSSQVAFCPHSLDQVMSRKWNQLSHDATCGQGVGGLHEGFSELQHL